MNNQATNNAAIKEKLKIFLNRSSVRKYRPEKIPSDIMDQLLAAAMQAPTSSHVQAFALINVTKPELRQSFFELSGKQQWILDASHFFIICADLHKIASWSSLDLDGSALSQDAYLASLLDGALVGMTLSLAAEALNIGSVMIGSIRNSVEETAKYLGLPHGVMPLFGLCLGYYDVRKKPKPRLPKKLFVFENTYEWPENNRELLHEYQNNLTEYYKANDLEHSGLRTSNVTWLDVVTASVQNKKRQHMGIYLQERGFDFSKRS